MSTISVTMGLKPVECGACGTWHAVPEKMLAKAKQEGTSWTCPRGCVIGYHDSENKRLSKELDAEKARRAKAEGDAAVAKMERDGAKLETEKLKRRLVAGLCPCCTRHFKQLAAHLANKHAPFVDEIEAARKRRKP